MKQVDFGPGTHISVAARMLCDAAPAEGHFNETHIVADAGDTPESVVARYDAAVNARAEAYRASLEGKAAERAANDRRSALQATHDVLMAKLPSLDWGSDVAVLDWMCAMQEPSDHVGVIVRGDTIVAAFEKHGFVAGANCGTNYRPGDRDNMFRYLIGQGLSGLKDGPAIHSIIHKFAGDWKDQFIQSAA